MRRAITFIALLIFSMGLLFSQQKVAKEPGLNSREVQVTEGKIWYPSASSQKDPQIPQKGPSQDSLIMYVLSFLAELSATPDISNYNENYVNFVYEDSLLTEEVAKVLGETLRLIQQSQTDIVDDLSHEIGMRVDYTAETLVRLKKLEATAYLAWPILIGLSLALLIIGSISERRLLQYTGVGLLVASLIGSAIYLPDILAIGVYRDIIDGLTKL